MKINAPRRSIINDALDLYTPTRGVPVEGDSLVELPIALIKPYHDHPFHLYSGTRLDDMVESIRDKGVNTTHQRNKSSNFYFTHSSHLTGYIFILFTTNNTTMLSSTETENFIMIGESTPKTGSIIP